MPFLEGATSVEVLTIRSGNDSGASGPVPPVSIRDHMAAHGVVAVREQLVGDGVRVMDLILSRAFDVGADLLVMGGFGGYHLPFLKGSGTRHILRHMTLPVLVSY